MSCIRDTADDPAYIRAFFEKIDRQEFHGQTNLVFFEFESRSMGFSEFIREINFRDGREDAAPLEVTAIQRLELPGKSAENPSYVMGTTRSAWFDRGSALHSSYTEIHDTWLVSFSGCEIHMVRQIPELRYLISGN